MSKSELEGARVLVVEDEYFIASDLVRAVDSAGGKAIGPAGSLDQATDLLDKEPVDAAILDLNLHGEMASPLVEGLAQRGVPCIIISGYSPESLPENLRSVPSLEKPANYDKVVQLLAEHIRTRAL